MVRHAHIDTFEESNELQDDISIKCIDQEHEECRFIYCICECHEEDIGELDE